MVPDSPTIQYSLSRSSLTPSTPSTEAGPGPNLQSLLALSTSTTSSKNRTKHAARRSLNILGNLPKDFSSLIRSHSVSRRQGPLVEAEQSRGPAKVLLTEYAGTVNMLKEDMHLQPEDMFSPESERPSRKQKSENRLYNFLHRSRSRSRSRSKARPSTSGNHSPVPELPNNGHTRHSSMGQVDHRPISPSSIVSNPASKPTTRLQSRPLSSTTTATNTTITPRTPTQTTRKPKKHPPDLTTQSHPAQENNPSRPSTPKPSATRKKLHTLFGIPLSSPKKSSFNSRSNSPGPSHYQGGHDHDHEAPPLPHHESSTPSTHHDPTRDQNRPTSPSHTPQPMSRTQSPSPASRTKPAYSSTNSKLDFFRAPKFFSARGAPSPPILTTNIHAHNPQQSDPAPSTISRIPSVSGPTKSKSHRRNTRGSLDDTTAQSRSQAQIPTRNHEGQTHRTTGIAASQPRKSTPAAMESIIPRIMHTPATPLRPTTSPPRMHGRSDSIDSQGERRWRPMAMVNEERSTERRGREKDEKGKGKGKEREKDKDRDRRGKIVHMSNEREGSTHGRRVYAPVKSGTGIGAQRGVKHGSFDFERPGWGTGSVSGSGSVIGRSASGGSGGSAITGGGTAARSGYSRSGESLLGGPGIAGIGTPKRSLSLKRAQESGNGNGNGERHHQPQPTLPHPPLHPDDTGSSHTTDQTQSTSFSGTGTGLSSSLGRAGGKRATRSAGTGVTRLVGVSHGPFAFEPPVPSPTMSTGTTASAGEVRPPPKDARDERREGRERERAKERERERDKVKDKEKRRGTGVDRPAVPIPPVNPSAGHRSGTKGRSLDLGLGLAWAPTKVREDALMPSSYGRSLSASRREREQEKDKSKVGREVAEVFRNALDEEGYAAFKKYVHRFDAHDIPFDGPSGIVERVENLLKTAPNLGDEGKRRLLDSFVRIILQNA